MRWLLLWIVLFLAAGSLLGLLGRNLWRKSKALSAEVTAASDRLAAVSASLTELADRPNPPHLQRAPRWDDDHETSGPE
jgi:hypothetical protein